MWHISHVDMVKTPIDKKKIKNDHDAASDQRINQIAKSSLMSQFPHGPGPGPSCANLSGVVWQCTHTWTLRGKKHTHRVCVVS